MTTTQETPAIWQILRDRRGTRYQTVVADEIGVSRQMYRQWETGHAIPGDEWVGPLMVYLGMKEMQVVAMLYQSRKTRQGGAAAILGGLLVITWNPGTQTDYEPVPWFVRPIDIPVAA
jgi:hypothetical protein